MNDRTPFWRRVHALLDERKDPLEDAAVREHLVEHPEDFAALERMARPLGALPGFAVVPPRLRRWRWALPPLAVAGVVAAVLLLGPRDVDPPHALDDDPAPDASASRSVVFDYRVELVLEDGESRIQHTLTPDGEARRVERLGLPADIHSYYVAYTVEASR